MTTPEESLRRAASKVYATCGHWPVTYRTEAVCGWRPAGDACTRWAGDRPMRMETTYDMAIVCRRGEARMGGRRYALYDALRREGWRIMDTGPESYDPKTDLFYWPMTVMRAWRIDEDGTPLPIQTGGGTADG